MSSEMQRYQPKANGYSLESHPCGLIECDDGPAVLYADAQRALDEERKKVRKLREAASFAQVVLTTILDDHGELCSRMRETRDKITNALNDTEG